VILEHNVHQNVPGERDVGLKDVVAVNTSQKKYRIIVECWNNAKRERVERRTIDLDPRKKEGVGVVGGTLTKDLDYTITKQEELPTPAPVLRVSP